MKIFALILFIIGLLFTGLTAPIAIFGAGPFLLGLSYVVYLHSLILKK